MKKEYRAHWKVELEKKFNCEPTIYNKEDITIEQFITNLLCQQEEFYLWKLNAKD